MSRNGEIPLCCSYDYIWIWRSFRAGMVFIPVKSGMARRALKAGIVVRGSYGVRQFPPGK